MKGLGILCPGQGEQHPAMFELFVEDAGAAQLLRDGAFQLRRDARAFDGDLDGALFDNAMAQPLICLRQLVAWRALATKLPRPRLFAGYSLGEFAAYGCAGALSPAETLRLAERRAALMDAVSPPAAGLAAVRGLTRERVEVCCAATGAAIAIVNGADHHVVGGTVAALAALEVAALAAGAHKVLRLPVTVPSHTGVLEPAGVAFRAELAAGSFGAPHLPVLAGIDGAVVRDRAAGLDALAGQVWQPLRWDLCQQAALETGCGVFLELGPGSALARMLRESHPDIPVRAVDEFRTLQGVIDWVVRQCAT